MTVQFTDTSTPGSAPITSWLWDFDDATTSTEQNPTHIYRHIPGIYSVTLTVSTSVGEDTVTRSSLILVTQYVPDVTGLLRAEAESLLSAAGISVGAVTEEWSTTISTGRVIRQVVPEDQGEEMINTLDLVISLGKVMDVYRYGDVNMKDGITSADYAAMIRAQSSTDPVVRALADVTHDGVVDSEDTQLLLRYLRSGGFVNATVRRLMAQAGANEVFLLWAPVPHDNVAGYRVYRSMDTAEPRTWIRMNEGENTPDTVFTDGTVESTTYFYRVSFVDILGNESGNSAPVEVVANTIIMSLPKIWGEAGDLVRVPVNLGNARGLTPKDIFVALQYDTDWATYVEVKPTPLTTAVDFLADATLPGLVNIMSQDTNNSLPGGEGRFFDLYLTLKSNPPNTCSDLLFGGDTVLTDSLGANIALKLNPGKLCIGAGTWGDLDGSGDVTEADAMIALEIAVEKLSLDPDDERNLFGDLNGDSMIDAADAVMILRMARDLSINPEANAKGDTKQITPRALMLDQVSAAKGCIATLPVALDDISALAGMDLVVSFPRQDLECVGVRTTEATADFKVDSQIAAGYARISLSDAQALGSGAADVLELDFRVTGEVTTTDKPAPIVKLNYAELKGELGESFRWYADVAKTNGLVTILPAADCPVEPEGEPEGQTEGAIEGQASDGQVNDGETPEGLAVEGQPLEGESVDGETVDGEIVDGEPATAQPSSKEGQAPLNDIPIPSIKGCFACAI
jgi:PKD repeat protein